MEWLIGAEFAALFFIFLFNLKQIMTLGGFSRHIAYAFSLLVYSVYELYTPAFNYFAGYRSLYGIDIEAYFPEALAVYIVGMLALTFGYWASVHLRPAKPIKTLETYHDFRQPLLLIAIMCIVFGYLVFHNLTKAGFVDFGTLFNFKDQRSGIVYLYTLTSPHPEFPYIEALTDTFITLLVLLFAYKMPRLAWWILAIAIGYFFLLTGWRYRLILTAIGCFAFYWCSLRWFREDYMKVAVIIAIGLFSLVLLTLNRMAIAKRLGEETTLDLSRFDGRLLSEQTINSQVFMAMLRYRDEHNLSLDYGQSMFMNTVYRAIPSSYLDGGVKPQSKLLRWQLLAQGNTEGVVTERTGAITNVEEYYFSFGWAGVIGLTALLGWPLGRLAHFPPKDTFYNIVKALVAAFMFQLITRGYFPQQVELFVYLFFPLIFVRLISHYKIPDSSSVYVPRKSK